jgi:hypothetical protein
MDGRDKRWTGARHPYLCVVLERGSLPLYLLLSYLLVSTSGLGPGH